MSKPPSKSGGSGRGRPPHGSSGGGPRDKSPFAGSSRGEGRSGGRGGAGRDEAPRGGGSRYNSGGGSAGARSGGGREEGRSGGSARSGYARDAGPQGRGSGNRIGGARDGGPRDGAPRGRVGRDESARQDRPRAGSRDGFTARDRYTPRDGGAQRPPRRDDQRRDDAPRDGAPRDVAPRQSTPHGAYARDSFPREGGSRDGAPRATYSRGGPRDDRARDNRARDDRRSRDDSRYTRGDAQRGARAPTRPIAAPGPAPRAARPTHKNPDLPAREGERIAKLLARAGVASRREVERLIIEGRVRLDDTVIETPSTVLTSLAGITVDGNPIAEPEGTRLFLFHKPAGLITAERDPAGRPTIYNALRNALPPGTGRVMPIGRLDLSTEGLLLLTNDGEFKRQLELPATGVPRTYRARTFGDITQDRLEELMEGIEVDGVIYGKINANMERRTGRNQWIEMTLTEGKNREVRRVLEALGLQVSRLLRTSYGPFLLGDMPKGAAGEVSQKDLEIFRRSLKESQAREAKEAAGRTSDTAEAQTAGIAPEAEAKEPDA